MTELNRPTPVPAVGDPIPGCVQVGHYGPHDARPDCLVTDAEGRGVHPYPRAWWRNDHGGITDGRGWEVYRDAADLADDGRPWSLWHHGEYVGTYVTADAAIRDATPVDCSKCDEIRPSAPVAT